MFGSFCDIYIDRSRYGDVVADAGSVTLIVWAGAHEADRAPPRHALDSDFQKYWRSPAKRAKLSLAFTRIAQSRRRWVGAKYGRQFNLSGLVQARVNVSVVDQVRNGTDALFNALPPGCRPNFIRCINPKRGGEIVAATMRERFNVLRVKEQLINNGIIDTVQARQQGFGETQAISNVLQLDVQGGL